MAGARSMPTAEALPTAHSTAHRPAAHRPTAHRPTAHRPTAHHPAVSALVDCPIVSRTPVGAEARGLARDFCRRVGLEAELINAQSIGAPLRRRIARYPDRRPREDLLRDLERNWREARPQQFRLEFRSAWKGRDVFMMERAVTRLDAFRLPHWDANDYGVEVVDTWFAVARGRPDAGKRSRIWIGSHALARWYQRGRARSDAQLLHDIGVGAAIDSSDRDAFPDLDDVRVPVDNAAGWRGAMMVAAEADENALVFHARTFF